MTNKEFFTQCWKSEMKTTAKAVRALPAEMNKLSYKPNEKSRSAAQIIEHILPHAEYLAKGIETGMIEEVDKKFNSTEEAASYLEKHSAELIDKLAMVDDKTWDSKIVPMMMNGNKIFEAPMFNMYWSFLFDVIHHRGQLSTYYRSMGVRNPSIYGPTAEDMEEMMTGAKN